MNLASLRANREKILEIAARHGAYNVRIFGSVARGEATETSDIDFLVKLEESRSLLDRIGLIQDLEDFLHCRVDVVKLENLHEQIRRQILQEAVVL